MQVVQASRASAILYNLLVNRDNKLPWLLPANICPIVPITFLKAETLFEFVDISAETLHMDLKQVDTLIKSRKFGGVVYAHTYGEESTPYDFFYKLKRLDASLLLVDDRCLCIPKLEPDTDNWADVQLYSTGYSKIVDFGIGGYAYLRVDLPYHPVHLPFDLNDYMQIERDYKQHVQGRSLYEYKDCNWLATDADLPAWQDYTQQIKTGIDSSLAQRTRLNSIYSFRLPPELQLQDKFNGWRFNIRVQNKLKVIDAIFKAGLFVSSHYASLAGIMREGRCPQAELLFSEVINLFNDHYFDEQKAEKVCTIILENLS